MLALCFVAAISALAQPASPPPPACTAPEFGQFDFWLGKWTVRRPDGKVAGTSEITRVSEGCAIREDWTNARGQHATSLNYYDRQDARWHQHWVGADGTILHLQGGLEGDAMLLTGETSRFRWSPLADGKVKQEWSRTSNGGRTWETRFVGIYERR